MVKYRFNPKNDNIDHPYILGALEMLIFWLLIPGSSTFMIFWSQGNKIQKLYLWVDLKFITIKTTLKLWERFIIKLWIMFFTLFLPLIQLNFLKTWICHRVTKCLCHLYLVSTPKMLLNFIIYVIYKTIFSFSIKIYT